MKTAAVLPCKGIGDALLMMIASHQLLKEGYRVTTFHPALAQLQKWFPNHRFGTDPQLELFDLIIVENDNSPKINNLLTQRLKSLSILYPTYSASKHAPLGSLDRIFDPRLPMAENIARAVAGLMGRHAVSKDNGLIAPHGLMHRYYRQRVVIHPMSSLPEKNWRRASYLKLARDLTKRNFEPVFVVGPEERKAWPEAPLLPTLSDLAQLIYESGFVIGNDSLVGHLGSNMQIPTLIIGDNAQRMQLWRPGWLRGEVVTPPGWVPNWKFMRLRQNHWQRFITRSQILLRFEQLARAF